MTIRLPLLLPLASAVLYAAAAIFIKAAISRGMSSWVVTFWSNISMGVLFLPVLLLGPGGWHPSALPWALLAGHVVSRAFALLPMATLDYARDDDSAKSRPLAARLSPWALVSAGLLTLAVVQPLPAGQAAAGVVLAMLGSCWLMRQFKRWLGGYTGDCLGAVQQVAELAFYLGLLLRWPQGSA